MSQVAAGPRLGLLERACAALVEFFAAWRSPAFSLLWSYKFMVTIAGSLSGTWSFYWYSDVVCNADVTGVCHYEFFGHHVTGEGDIGPTRPVVLQSILYTVVMACQSALGRGGGRGHAGLP